MNIKLHIQEMRIKHQSNPPVCREYHGNFALELMLKELIEKYYSPKVWVMVESILTGRIE
jgi:hypothetical protein